MEGERRGKDPSDQTPCVYDYLQYTQNDCSITLYFEFTHTRERIPQALENLSDSGVTETPLRKVPPIFLTLLGSQD